MMRLFFVLLLTLFLTACVRDESDQLSTIPVNAIQRIVSLGNQSLVYSSVRPAAILGILATDHLARVSISSVLHPSFIGILQQKHLLHGERTPERGAQTSLEQLGTLIQINVPDLLNRNFNRADALNTYIDQMEKTLYEARIQYTLLETFLDDIAKIYNTTRKELSSEQKKQNKAMKDRQFAQASAMQERLLLLHRDLAESEFKKNEAENIQELLEEMIEISQKRLTALHENREILIAGLSVKELPGMDDLGILKSKKKKSLFQ